MYSEKLIKFFKAKGLKQKEVGQILGFSPAMTGRYLHGTANIGSEFLISLSRNFPELDLNTLFMDDNRELDTVGESGEKYESTILTDILEIEDKLQLLKEKLARINVKD
ncbi:helix-turn-helix domain-containing protein [Flavobacterium poyangense]|uniref:helix-turn-helix domain-containing protein n=1 Tax=Flavobacterium poyangense TaxID=2204302 RepID=UPI001420AF5C|nr:helix-turn-helix transcriptional regulator [Flavobacterium sp. JXAS1]